MLRNSAASYLRQGRISPAKKQAETKRCYHALSSLSFFFFAQIGIRILTQRKAPVSGPQAGAALQRDRFAADIGSILACQKDACPADIFLRIAEPA